MSLTEEEMRLAQPDAVEDVKLEAWYMDDSDADQRLPHKLTPCPAAVIAELGVISWRMDADAYPDDPKLTAIKKARGYNYDDLVNISSEHPNYDNLLKMFYSEHIHSDEEIRYVVDGSGYFDVRDREDRWIRIWTKRGDLIVLPEGIYHRFTLDEADYIQALRLFCGVPVWTPFNRPQDEHPSRLKYVNDFAAAETA